ncbi:beta-lactamase hydrolase domain-containing protein [Arsukibacterium sp.]|uniref:beta-lactamase hydrolase domain-containing protein n=1 Tax=Arsukibacterium sp. TaxID=1977258 RepID=UPI00299CD493|nr:sulfur transferase domain-containing protein [Arsukibacterium sp.]MDX1676720.1 sulfur transferase domain-containing protein [Arsukibacterium sp.]
MSTTKQLLTIIIFGLMLVGYHAESLADSAIPDNFNQPGQNLITGGQPSMQELEQLKAAGVRKVINLRGADEAVSYDEQAAAEALGLTYISLPVAGAGDVTVDKARALYQHLQGDQKILVHCASGNRVGALLAIGAHEINDKPLAEALAFGRAAGLSSLEPKVRAVLSEPGEN